MRQQLADEAEALFEALDSSSPVSVRLNPQKWIGDSLGESVPWSRYGRYLDHRPQFTTHIPFAAGGYYVQEAGSQFIDYILHSEGVEGGKILDMCAAPGGKSTQLRLKLGEDGVLVSNEIIPSRCKILTSNVERLGLKNVITTCMDSERIARLYPKTFDFIMVDAPCSGEGMFRKEQIAIDEWSKENVEKCATRQKEILENFKNASSDKNYKKQKSFFDKLKDMFD